MVPHQMLLIPRVLFHLFVIIHAFKHNLAEAVEFGQVSHLMIEQPTHESAGLGCIVDLFNLAGAEVRGKILTMVHRFTPYFTIRSFVIGAETCVM